MKVIGAVVAGFAALVLGACATTETSNRQELVDAGQLRGDQTDGDRVRCENVRETGSRMTTRICLTQREWDEMEENAQQVVQDRNEQSQQVLPGAGGFGGGR
ncbi:hypothetical protein NHF40_13750 [Maricaulaceae bacterium EIL42A08]|nr:hypothetical protein [Maricaulaceae bacterium EIL42A08]